MLIIFSTITWDIAEGRKEHSARLYSGDKIVRSTWLVSSNLTGGSCAPYHKLARTQLGLCNSWPTQNALWCFQSAVLLQRTHLSECCSFWRHHHLQASAAIGTPPLAYRLDDRVSAFIFSFFSGWDWDTIGGSRLADSLHQTVCVLKSSCTFARELTDNCCNLNVATSFLLFFPTAITLSSTSSSLLQQPFPIKVTAEYHQANLWLSSAVETGITQVSLKTSSLKHIVASQNDKNVLTVAD